ncbi:hypothetical protein KQX54_001667 [Cotesia glomerata]|uniref:Uncharacterized protein n=1 Tax=Cotesia glomerata TaxID=32391 RepID=A0AAV7IWP8_COTGL|nr:hypothetical protein KQX54_001667 [Cotesia glomerata]
MKSSPSSSPKGISLRDVSRSTTSQRCRGDSVGKKSSHRLDSGSPFWRIQLDQDLLDTISAIYPEWFKDYTNSSRTSISSIISSSPTHQSNDESIDRDKASDSTDQEGQGHKSAKEVKTKSKVRKLEKSKDRREKRQIREVDRDLPGSETVKKGAKHPPSGPRHERERTENSSTGRKSAGGASEDTSPESEESAEMAEGNRSSPPKAEVDDSPLQYAMDRNKEYRVRADEFTFWNLLSLEKTDCPRDPIRRDDGL